MATDKPKKTDWPVVCHWCGVKGRVSRELEPPAGYEWQCKDCWSTQRTLYNDPDRRVAAGSVALHRHAEWSHIMGYSTREGGAEQGDSGDDD